MTAPIQFDKPEEIVRRYVQGESENSIALSLGVSRSVITRVLRGNQVQLRSNREANRLMMRSRTTEENQRNSAAAHEAAKHHVHTQEEKFKRAITRERKQLHIAADELYLAELLAKRGIQSQPQKAIGAYNCDLAVGDVAVEIYGGSWHASGRHAARSDERFEYLLSQGWRVIVVWVDRRRWPIRPQVVLPIVKFINQPNSEKMLVLNGTGQILARESSDVGVLRQSPSINAAA